MTCDPSFDEVGDQTRERHVIEAGRSATVRIAGTFTLLL